MSVKLTILFLAQLSVLCLGSGLEDDGDGADGYEFFPHLHGCLKLYLDPADWDTARNNCLAKEGKLAPTWSPRFVAVINKLLQRSGRTLPVLFSEARKKSAHNDVAPLLGDRERCGAFFTNGSAGEVNCAEQLPYVCYARASVSTCLRFPSKHGYQYYAQLHGWLKLHRHPAVWQEARSKCHQEGALLASPWSAEFSSTMKTIQSSDDTQTALIPALFSGLYIMKTFVEGELPYEGMPALPPIMSGSLRLERCGVFYANGSEGEADCKKPLPYVCYEMAKPATTPAPTTVPTPAPTLAPTTVPTLALDLSCGENSIGYEFSNQTGRCYKFYAQKVLWSEANSTCVAEGAHLPVSGSPAETLVLTNLFERHYDVATHDSFTNNMIPVGIYWESGVWKTINGSTFAQVGGHPEWWTDNGPNYMDKNSYVYMFRNGKLYNYKNEFDYTFICEKAAATTTAPTPAPTTVPTPTIP